MRIGVFASGGGTNLQALIDRARPPGPAEIVLVLSDKADAGALERARQADIPTIIVEDHRDGEHILRTFHDANVELVVLAGYLKLVPPEVVAAFSGKMLNIHPALLPAFGGPGMYGMRVHRAVIESGATVSGATVHLVDEEYDRGPIIAQWPVPVMVGDTPETLAHRILEIEHQLLPTVVINSARRGTVERIPFEELAFTGAPEAECDRALTRTNNS